MPLAQLNYALPPTMSEHCEFFQLECGKVVVAVRGGEQLIVFEDDIIFEEWANDNEANHTDYNNIMEASDNDKISDEERDIKLARWLGSVNSCMQGYGGPSKVTLVMRELMNSVQLLIGRDVTLFPN